MKHNEIKRESSVFKALNVQCMSINGRERRRFYSFTTLTPVRIVFKYFNGATECRHTYIDHNLLFCILTLLRSSKIGDILIFRTSSVYSKLSKDAPKTMATGLSLWLECRPYRFVSTSKWIEPNQ